MEQEAIGVKDIPGVLAPPPLVYLGGLAIGLALQWAWPVRVPHGQPIGAGLALAGIALMPKGLELKLAKDKCQTLATEEASRIHGLVQEAMSHASDLARTPRQRALPAPVGAPPRSRGSGRSTFRTVRRPGSSFPVRFVSPATRSISQ